MTRRRLNPGDRLRAEVTGLDDEGLGVADGSDPGRPLRVEDGLPGESGEVVLVHLGTRLHGRMVRRDADAPERIAPPCDRWTPASPCRLMHLSPAAQAAFKRDRVAGALAGAGLGEVPVAETTVAGTDLGWRSRATFVAARDAAGLVLGAYRRGSHRVQGMAGCPLVRPGIAAAFRALAGALADAAVPVADPALPVARDAGCGSPREVGALVAAAAARRGPRGGGGLVPDGLRYLVLRANGRDEAAAALLTPSGHLAGAERIAATARAACPSLRSVSLGRAGDGDGIFGPGPLASLGPAAPLLVDAGGLAFEVSPRAFFQVHLDAAAALHARAAAAAIGDTVVDVYAGVGALTLRLARRARRVVGLEAIGDAVLDAEANARRNGLADRVTFRAEPAETGLAALAAEGLRPDTVTLDPPRKGCATGVLDALVALAPGRVVYVSCNPKTLARDLARLVAAGYRVTEVVPADLFPLSEHVEALAVLDRVSGAG